MKKHVKNLKVCWIPLLAMALTVTIVSCENEKMVQKHQQEIYENNISSLNEHYQQIRDIYEKNRANSITATPDEAESETESSDEDNFHR